MNIFKKLTKEQPVDPNKVELVKSFNYSVGDFKFNVSLRTDTTREAIAMRSIAKKVIEECEKLINEIEARQE